MSDFGASLRFYRDQLGLTEVALYDDPPYATLTAAGARISLAEQGHPAPDRPGVAMTTPADPTRADVMLVLEVPDADVARKAFEARRVRFLAETYRPPWGGSRFFCVPRRLPGRDRAAAHSYVHSATLMPTLRRSGRDVGG